MTKVLIFSRDSGWFGGVVNFIDLMKSRLSPDIVSVQFMVGRRTGRLGLLLRPIVPLLDAVRLLLHVVQNKYDCYHLNPSLNGPSLIRDGLFLFVLYATGCRNILISFHGWELTTEKTIESSAWRKWLFMKLFGRADCILVLAREFKDWLVKHGCDGDKVHLFTTMFDGEVVPDIKRKSLSDGDEINLLFLSRFVREKGVFELLGAFKSLVDKYPNIRLIFAGTGPAESEMQEWVKRESLTDKVEFKGYVRDMDKSDVLMSSHIFVFPTYYGEGCPVSLLEAMAAGMPVITTTVGGIPDIVKDPVNGVLLGNSVTAGAVADAIESLVSSPSRISDIGESNRVEAWEKYDAPVVTQFFEDIYKHGCVDNEQ